MGQDASESLSALFEKIEDRTQGDRVSIEELVNALGQRAFGPMFALVSLLAILPTGAIPGMSVLTGAIMLLLSLQLLFGKSTIWLPGFVTKRTLPRQELINSLEKARGPAQRVSRVIGPRLELFARPPFINVLAFLSALVSLSMFPLAVVPFGAFPAGIALLVLGIGLAVRDGLLLLVGIVIGLVGATVALTTLF